MKQVRARYPEVPGRADYCVYWFRRAHDELGNGARAGLVGTNTIRQNYSREGGLDHIVKSGGTITEAVSTMVWPGEAVVHVSIVNWIKGEHDGEKKLSWQAGDARDSPWKTVMLDRIPSSLSPDIDVTHAHPLRTNVESEACYQGQTHGHEGFLLSADEARLIRADKAARSSIHPYLIGEDLVGRLASDSSRWVIDLNDCEDLIAARTHGSAFDRVRRLVLPDVGAAAEREREDSKKSTGPRQAHAQRWWKHWRGRGELLSKLQHLTRYIACSRVTKRPIFEFVSATIHPSDVVGLALWKTSGARSAFFSQLGMHWCLHHVVNARRCTMKRGTGAIRRTPSSTASLGPRRRTRSNVAGGGQTSRCHWGSRRAGAGSAPRGAQLPFQRGMPPDGRHGEADPG